MREAPLKELRDIIYNEKKTVTLLFGAKNEQHNQAVVLKEILEQPSI